MWNAGIISYSRLNIVLARNIQTTVVPKNTIASIMKLFTDQGNPFLFRVLAAKNLSQAPLSVVFVKNGDKQTFKFPGNAKFPFLEVDDGAMLFSPNAICRYLLDFKSGSRSATTDPETAALEDHWLEWDSTCLQGSVIPYLTSTICHGKAEQSHVSQLEDQLKHLDTTLSSQPHLSGDHLGLADVVVWGSLYPVLSASSPFSGSQFESLTKWFKRAMSSEAFVKSVQEVTAGKGLATLRNSLLSISGIHTSPASGVDGGSPTDKSSKPKASQAPKQSINDGNGSDEAKQQASAAEKDAALKAWNHGHKKRPSAQRLDHPILPKEGERNILITSALPYVNNVPHLGNIIGCVLSADVFARFCRLRQYNTLYICGTDEYGTATETKALEEGLTPQQICDKYFTIHRDVYQWFNIKFDHFGRTTTEQQTQISQDIFWRLRERGHIAEDSLEQLQCLSCQRFLADRFVEGTCPFCNYEDARGDQCDACGKLINAIELKNPHCKVCGGKTEVRTSKHLFLNLTELEPTLKEWVDKSSNEGTWTSNARHITRGWIQEGLKPRCITRDLKWGTPVPLEGYTDKVFYVWFDAPIGYLSITANYTTEWEKWWKNPEQVTLYQFMAKDNVPFHTVVFPSTLLGADDNYTLLDSISATEYLNYEEDKFSKSRGVGIFGDNAAETGIPADIWRFYLLYLRPENQDSAFSWSDFVLKNNSELLNNLGNFVNRALSFLHNNFEGVVPKMELNEDDKNFIALVNRELGTYIENLEHVRLRDGLRDVLSISKLGNQYIQANKPWVLVKGSAADKSRAGTIIGVATNVSWLISLLIHPYMPQVSAEIQQQLQVTDDGNVIMERFTPYVHTGHKIATPSPLFQKIDASFADELRAKYAGKKKAPASQVDSGDIESLKAQVTEQGNKVRKLKAEKADKEKIDAEVKTLLSLKEKLARAGGNDAKESAAGSKGKKKGKK